MNTLLLSFATRYWREALIGALIVRIFAACVHRDHDLVAKGVAEEQGRQANAILGVTVPLRLKAETSLVHDIKVVSRVTVRHDTVDRWRSDTVFIAGDTAPRIAVPVSEVAKDDTTRKACSDLVVSCAAFREYATQEIAAWKSKAAIAPSIKQRSLLVPSLLAFGSGFLTHVLITRGAHK